MSRKHNSRNAGDGKPALTGLTGRFTQPKNQHKNPSLEKAHGPKGNGAYLLTLKHLQQRQRLGGAPLGQRLARKLQKLGEGCRTASTTALRKTQHFQPLQTASLWNWETINFCCSSPFICVLCYGSFSKLRKLGLKVRITYNIAIQNCMLLPLSYKAMSIPQSCHFLKGFPSDSDGKESAYNAGDSGLIPRSGRSPGEGNGNPLQIPWNLPGNLVGYSPWDHKESGMIEWLNGWPLPNNAYFQMKAFIWLINPGHIPVHVQERL